MKRKTWGILLTTAVLGLSGCGGTQLTDKQTSEAAEYMAGLILKYDKNYTDTLVYPEETVAPEETVTPTASSNPEEDSIGIIEDQQASQTGTKEDGQEGSFSNVLGVTNIKVSFKDAYLAKEYKEKEDSSYAVYPASGKTLAVVRLNVKNTSKKDKKIFLTERGVEYKLKLSDGTSCSSEITAISNDLNFLNTKIKAGKKKTVVLIFSVPKNVKNVDGVLSAFAEQKTATLAIK